MTIHLFVTSYLLCFVYCFSIMLIRSAVAFRLSSLLMTIASLLFCACYAFVNYVSCAFNLNFFLVCIDICILHVCVNLLSDYKDFKYGIDNILSTGSSGAIVSGLINPDRVLLLFYVFTFIFIIIGLISVYFLGIKILFIGCVALLLSLSYTEWPLRLKYRACGELCVFILFGPILTYVAIFSLTHDFNTVDLLCSFITGGFVTSVLLANNIRDYKYDINKTITFVTKYGLKKAYILNYIIVHLFYIDVLLLVYVGRFPKSSLFVLLSYILVIFSFFYMKSWKYIHIFFWGHIINCVILSLSFIYG